MRFSINRAATDRSSVSQVVRVALPAMLLGLPLTQLAGADDDSLEAGVLRSGPVVGGAVVGGDEVGTAASSVLEAEGDLARGLGQGSLLKSMSAKEFQKALALELKNREESVEAYWRLKKLNDEATKDKSKLSSSQYRKLVKDNLPDRLGKNQLDPQSGKMFWPKPLDHELLAPYRKPIEETFAKRSSPGEKYTKWDYLRVARMVDLISEALESIEDDMAPRETVALKDYLAQIDFDARFNAAGERVDY